MIPTTTATTTATTHQTQTQQFGWFRQRIARTICHAKTSNQNNDDDDADEEGWQVLLSGFQMYRAAYGDLKVPSRFVVPSMPPWPEPAWGLKLGNRVASIRSTGKYVHNNESRRKVLDELGFQWRVRGGTRDKKMDGIAFAQVYDALSCYRRVVQPPVFSGDDDAILTPLEVPSNFVVPDCDPWPESTRGLPLGRKIPTIRNPAYWRAQPAGTKERLESLGLDLDDQPGGGSGGSSNDQRFQLVFNALLRYKELHGDLLVPQPFEIPDDGSDPGWPDDRMWGLRLGARVNAIRSLGTFVRTDPSRRTRLNEIGFVWEPPTPENKRRGRHKKVENEALMGPAPPGLLSTTNDQDPPSDEPDDREAEEQDENTYSDSNSNSNIGSFGPSSPPVPRRTSFDPLVGGPISPSDDFSYELPQWGTLQDDLLPASQFQKPPPVPDWKPSPTFTENNAKSRKRALDIGIITEVDDKDRVIKSKIQAQHPWFNDDFGGEFVFEDVVEALTLYREFHDNFAGLDDDQYVVPEPDQTGGLDMFENDNGDDSSFLDEDGDDVFGSMLGGPSTTTTAPLGAQEDLIAQEIARMQMMTDLGGVDNDGDGGGGGIANLEPTEEDLLMVQQLEDDFLGLEPTTTSTATMATPSTTQVTETVNNNSWPEHLAGMRLGNIVRRIREGDLEVKHLPKRKKQLDAIEFDWGDPKKFLDVPFDKSMCALFAYYMIRGDLFVYEDFVMPDEEPWPRALAGYELGEAVFRLRAKQNFLEAYYPRKKYMLTMLEFVWFPLDALPLDPDAPPLSWEHEHVQHCGHPLARINAPPYSAIEHVHSVDHPEAKDRYEFSYDLVKDYYENTLGITDIGAFLRQRGYYQLADEHEAEYGKPVPVMSASSTAATTLGNYNVEETSVSSSTAAVEEETVFEEEEEYDEELNDEALDDEHFKYEDEDLDEDVLLEEEDEEYDDEEVADNDDDATEEETIYESEIL